MIINTDKTWCRGRSSEDRVLIRALLSHDIKICHRETESTRQFPPSLQVELSREGLSSVCGCTWDQLRVQEAKVSHLLATCKSKPPFQALSLSILCGFDIWLALCYLNLLKKKKIYLAVLGLNCSKQNLLVVECGIYFPDQGSNLGPLHWEPVVLTTGPPGKSLFEPS